MNSNKQYVIIGTFVIFTLTAMIVIGIWLAFGLSNTKYNNYVAIFKESVDGLQLNSDVKLNGVSVGKVSNIKIDQKNPSNVIVQLSVQQGTPITTSTYATLMSQGITGLSYVGLKNKYHKPPVQLLPPTPSPPYTEVPTQPSVLSNITEQIKKVSNDISNISDSVEQIVNAENSKKVVDIINNIHTVTNTLANNSQNIDKSIDSITSILKSASDASSHFNKTIDNINDTAESVSKVGYEVAKISQSVQNQTIQGLNQVIIPKFATTLGNLNKVSLQLNQLLNSINQNPSILVTGELPPPPGPGESGE